jgi:hypothetical protein
MERRGLFTRRGLGNVHGDVGMTDGQVSPVGVEVGTNGRIVPSVSEGQSYFRIRGRKFHPRQAPPSPR